MRYTELIEHITAGGADAAFTSLYGESAAEKRQRALDAIAAFGGLYGKEGEIMLLSVPGRSELSGNHTDHNHGRVIAASIDLDIIAVVRPREDSTVRLQSEGFRPNTVDLSRYTTPDENQLFTSNALIAGMAACFRDAGLRVGGFDAYTTSNVF